MFVLVLEMYVTIYKCNIQIVHIFKFRLKTFCKHRMKTYCPNSHSLGAREYEHININYMLDG